MGNFLKLILQISALAPVVIQAVEQIGQAAKLPGTTKKQLATQSLLLASGVAQAVDPNDTDAINTASEVAGQAIELAGQVSGLFHKSTSVTPISTPATTPITQTVP